MTALRAFVADLLEGEGAMVEAVEPDGLDVMAPDRLCAEYGWPELVRLSFGAVAPSGAIPIGLEDDWLDRLGGLLGDRGRVAERQLPMPENAAPPNDPERLIDGAMHLSNAIWRLNGVTPDWSRCLLLAFRYTAISDEKRDGLVWLGFNCSTGAVLGEDLTASLRRALDQADTWQLPSAEASQAAGPLWAADTIASRCRSLLDDRVRSELEPFLAAMRSRLDRDRLRVHAYHDDLRRAALAKLAGLEGAAGKKASEKTEAAIKREQIRIATIEREYASKLQDLRNNYALAVKVEWVQALVVVAPVQRHSLLVKRRKGERSIALDWHAAVRRMEPALSDWGDGLGIERIVCDEHLHLTDPAGQAPCSACSKAYCRACRPAACPRCHKLSSERSQ